MNTCKDCKYWEGIKYLNHPIVKGTCDFVNTIFADKEADKTFIVEASADDDSGLMVELITGANFGCIHFTNKD